MPKGYKHHKCREVSCKSANNNTRKAHESYQAASLPQTIKKGQQTDVIPSERGKNIIRLFVTRK